MSVGKRDLKVMAVENKKLLSKKKEGLIRRDIQNRMKESYRYSSWESIKNYLQTDTVLDSSWLGVWRYSAVFPACMDLVNNVCKAILTSFFPASWAGIVMLNFYIV
ncbi:hypothetical protein [Desulfocicer vacuolatum]|nr:hypothetical protein [Desulfocicer vacuolatum]